MCKWLGLREWAVGEGSFWTFSIKMSQDLEFRSYSPNRNRLVSQGRAGDSKYDVRDIEKTTEPATSALLSVDKNPNPTTRVTVTQLSSSEQPVICIPGT